MYRNLKTSAVANPRPKIKKHQRKLGGLRSPKRLNLESARYFLNPRIETHNGPLVAHTDTTLLVYRLAGTRRRTRRAGIS